MQIIWICVIKVERYVNDCFLFVQKSVKKDANLFIKESVIIYEFYSDNK